MKRLLDDGGKNVMPKTDFPVSKQLILGESQGGAVVSLPGLRPGGRRFDSCPCKNRSMVPLHK